MMLSPGKRGGFSNYMSLVLPMEQAKLPEAPFNKLPSLAGEAVSERLHEGNANIIRDLRVQLDTTVFRLLMSTHSDEDFKYLRGELFPKYVNLSTALASVAMVEIPFAMVEDLSRVAFQNLKATVNQRKGLDMPDDAWSELDFCLSALIEALRMGPELVRIIRPDHALSRVAELNLEFAQQILWSQMHIDCIFFAMHKHLSPKPEILNELLAGCRHAVMAYSAIKEAIDLCARDAQGELGAPMPVGR